MAVTRKQVVNSVTAYIAATVPDMEALAFLYWVWYRWQNEVTYTAVMKTEWDAWIMAGRPYIETHQGDGLTWAQIKAL